MMMTDSSGNTVWQGEFKPFGEPLLISGSITNNLRFPGQYYDAETGLHYNYFRDYNPVIGRYVEADPVGLAGGLHLYVYVGNGPVNWVDPWGLRSRKGWNPPDLNPPGLPPTPDTPSDDPFPFTPPPRNKSASCAVCKPVFHPNIYWSCVYTYAISQPYLDGYLAGFGFLAVPSGATTAIGAAGVLGISNYIGYTCRQKATYCD